MSAILSETASETRSPAAYRVMAMTRFWGLVIAASTARTWSWLNTSGSFLGCLANGMESMFQSLPSVLRYRKWRAQTA